MALVKAFVSALSLAALGTAAPTHHQGHNGLFVTLRSVSTITRYIYGPAPTVPPPVANNAQSKTKVKPGHETLPGVSYAPYRGDNGCKSSQEVQDDFQELAGHYSLVRIYGTDCDQIVNVYNAAKKVGIKKLYLGIWNINDAAAEAKKIIDGIHGDWKIVSTVSVGNELVNSGGASPEQVVAAVNQVRSILRAAGYQGPVVTVDTFNAVAAHPELCEASDHCAINAHAFFDATITADQAGPWLAKTVENIKSVAPGKKIIVTESGWPHQGTANGQAVPGPSQQLEAINSIKSAFANNIGDVVLFSAFNCPWKKAEPNTFYAEPYWGIGGRMSKSDTY
ncbi:glycoside hydrolase superfamily [Mariannaea sp. PMI_226]|nr:glycoside hydrolase superfamily [Mariannaea sp. PMI_226]